MNTIAVKASKFNGSKDKLAAAISWYASCLGCSEEMLDARFKDASEKVILIDTFDFDPDDDSDGAVGVLYY